MFQVGDRVEVTSVYSPFECYLGQCGVVQRKTWDYCYVVLLDGEASGILFLPRELKKEQVK